MGILTHALAQSGTLVIATINFYGDEVKQSSVDVTCRFRYITALDRNTNREALDAMDAMAWFEPDVEITYGSIIFIEEAYWRVESMVKARRMRGETVLFIKVGLKRHEIAEES